MDVDPSRDAPSQSASRRYALTDMVGRPVEVEHPPHRVDWFEPFSGDKNQR